MLISNTSLAFLYLLKGSCLQKFLINIEKHVYKGLNVEFNKWTTLLASPTALGLLFDAYSQACQAWEAVCTYIPLSLQLFTLSRPYSRAWGAVCAASSLFMLNSISNFLHFFPKIFKHLKLAFYLKYIIVGHIIPCKQNKIHEKSMSKHKTYPQHQHPTLKLLLVLEQFRPTIL